jgi:cob(I)alamin adenosyltransferase
MSSEKTRKSGSIATHTGDSGETSLLYGERVSKTHPQVEACGAVDELNAALGLAKATITDPARRAQLEAIQLDLIALMGELAVPSADLERYEESGFPKIDEVHLKRIDQAIDQLEAAGVKVEGWALPGANLHSAALDLARTTARRAERRIVTLLENQVPLRPLLEKYVNRISDYLWLLAREAENRK